jgi:sec-independent protein translocase protein TatA
MPFNLGGPELVFILVIVLIVFGAGKLPDVLGQLGRGVKSFRDEAGNEKPASVAASAGGTTSTTTASTTWTCKSCGRTNAADAKFCANCGTAH